MEQTISKPTASSVHPTPDIPWIPRSNISIFIHALHLLNLDQHRDWPNISESTFTSTKPVGAAQNSQLRVKSTEWSLYHLFQLFSPSETQSRLSPYFPATSPMHSKNLRAGLYNWLTELKTAGVLPRDVVLRKTMLDECKGEKFDEVLARFAMVVLRKAVRKETNNGGVTAREEQDADKLVALILAQRTSIRQNLRRRQGLREKASTCSEQLARLREDTAFAIQDIQSQPLSRDGASTEAGVSPEELDALRDQINLAFATDRRWARYILEGPSNTPDAALAVKQMPEWPFDNDVNQPLREQTHSSPEEDSNDPMNNLQNLIAKNRDRLQQLSHLRDSLASELTPALSAGENPQPSADASSNTFPPSPTKPAPQISKTRFNRHQDLVLRF